MGTSPSEPIDAYLTQDLKKRNLSLISIPVTFEDTQGIYNILGLKNSKILRMDGPILAGIYKGNIRFWDDLEIRAINSYATFPHRCIKVVHRADASGTPFVFTDYIAKTLKGWNESLGRNLSPTRRGGLGYNSSDAVVPAIVGTQASIGYEGLGWFNEYHLKSMAALQNRDGYYVVCSIKNIQTTGKASLHDRTFRMTSIGRRSGSYTEDIYPEDNFEIWMVGAILV